MAQVIMVCGKICCGKSTYSEKLRVERNAVVLGCDELLLSMFDGHQGDKHCEMLRRAKQYLCLVAEKILTAGSDVVLEFGFWTRSERDGCRQYFTGRGFETRLHYVRVTDEQLDRNIEARNAALLSGAAAGSYIVDSDLRERSDRMFEEPTADECPVIYEY